MNTFERCNLLAVRSQAELLPFLEQRGNRWILTDKGRLGEFLQKTVGDVVLNDQAGRMWTVEMKAEGRFTGNLFLEIWSNFNFRDYGSYVGFGPRPGWLLTMSADILFYHFPNEDRLFTMSLPALQRWAFCHQSANLSEPDARGKRSRLSGRVFDFRQVEQSAHQQKNQTVGAIVPIDVLKREMKVSEYRVRQLRMDFLGEAA